MTSNSISFIGILVSIVSLIISLKVYFRNNLYSTAQLETKSLSQVMAAKATVSSCQSDYNVFKNDASDIALQTTSDLLAAREDLVRVYNSICSHYLSKAVNRTLFEATYKSDILKLFDTPEYLEIIQSGDFQNLKTVHNKWHN